MKIEYKTSVYKANWLDDWLVVVITIDGKPRDLRKRFPIARKLTYSDEQKIYRASQWYGMQVVERYKRWNQHDFR